MESKNIDEKWKVGENGRRVGRWREGQGGAGRWKSRGKEREWRWEGRDREGQGGGKEGEGRGNGGGREWNIKEGFQARVVSPTMTTYI